MIRHTDNVLVWTLKKSMSPRKNQTLKFYDVICGEYFMYVLETFKEIH